MKQLINWNYPEITMDLTEEEFYKLIKFTYPNYHKSGGQSVSLNKYTVTGEVYDLGLQATCDLYRSRFRNVKAVQDALYMMYIS